MRFSNDSYSWTRRDGDSAGGRLRAISRLALLASSALVIALAVTSCGSSGMGTQPSPTPKRTVVTTPTPPPLPAMVPGVRGAGINVEPSYRPWRYLAGPAPESWWCVAPNCYPNEPPQDRIDTDLDLARQLGVDMVRVEFPWRFMEPQRGVYDFSRADDIVQSASHYGVRLQPIIVYSPDWVGDATAAPDPDDFAAFMTAIVTRYHSSIQYWEMWNEPDLSKYWSAGEQSYVTNILIPGYAAVKKADPNAQVILGGPSWASAGWFNAIYSDGGGNSFDIAAYHYYGAATDAILNAVTVQRVLIAHQQGSKPIWLGEFGVQDYTTTDSAQTNLLSGVLTSSSPIAQADWYTLRDEDAMMCCPPSAAVSASYGLVQRDGILQKAGFYALQRLIHNGLPKVS